jgi:diguanylate cyclase (GGDEF)-like protein
MAPSPQAADGTSIVIIGADAPTIRTLRRCVVGADPATTVLTARDRTEAMSLLASHAVEALVHHAEQGEDAFALLDALRDAQSDACVIVVGPDHGADLTAGLMRAGAYDYVTAPVRCHRLIESVRQGLENRRSFIQVRALSEEIRVANAQLSRERDGLRQWNRNLVLLNELSQAVAGTLDAAAIVRMVGLRLTDLLTADVVGVAWLYPSRTWIHASPSASEALTDRVRHALPAVAQRVYRGEPNHDVAGGEPAEPGQLDVPLMLANAPVGLLRLLRRTGEPFDEYQIQLIRAVAIPLALALRNAEAHQYMQSLAMTDGLTNLPNKRAFGEIAARSFRESVRYQTPVCLIMADVDHFKSLNDRHGHVAGDRVLRDVAALLGQTVRSSDVVARFGGEEFAIILPQTDIDQGSVLADRIRKVIEDHPFDSDGLRLPVTISLGIAEAPDSSIKTVEEFVAAADAALYRAKSRGRNRVERLPHAPTPLLATAPPAEPCVVGAAAGRC